MVLSSGNRFVATPEHPRRPSQGRGGRDLARPASGHPGEPGPRPWGDWPPPAAEDNKENLTTRSTKDKQQEQKEALDFVRILLDAPIKHIALENPVSVISSKIRKPNQIIQPWQFGHGETKKTCLWLKNLPPLQPTNIVEGREQRIWKLPPSKDRWKLRSITYQGIADAMAEQWGNL